MTRLEPLGNRILIKPDDAETMAGMLYVPDTAQVLPVFGTVTAIGPEVAKLKRGDRVVFGKYSGTEIPLDVRGKEKLIVMFETEVLCLEIPTLEGVDVGYRAEEVRRETR